MRARGIHDEALNDLLGETNELIEDIAANYAVPDDFVASMTVPEPRLNSFYLLVELHKGYSESLPLGYPARGITPMCSHPCEPLSKLIHEVLKPMLCRPKLPEFLEDSGDF